MEKRQEAGQSLSSGDAKAGDMAKDEKDTLIAQKSLLGDGKSSHVKPESQGKEERPLEEQLTNEKLKRLERIFEEADEDGGGGLDMEEFRHAMRQVTRGLLQTMGGHVTDEELDMIFMKVDTNCDGTVDWEEYLTYMLLECREKDSMSVKAMQPFPRDIRIFRGENRDSIMKILFMASIKQRASSTNIHDTQLDHKNGKYGIMSRDGVFTVTSLNLDQASVHRIRPSPPHQSIWITDMDYMPRVHVLAVSTTAREIMFFDVTNDKFSKISRITQLDACPTCLSFWTHHYSNDHSILLWGDDKGGICLIIFNKLFTATSLHPKVKGGRVRLLLAEILADKVAHVKGHLLRSIHSEPVRMVQYWQHMGCFISCAKDSEVAMYLGDIEQKLMCSQFKVYKGINSFDVCNSLNVIATGGFDALVRVWNPYVPAKPILLLRGHKSPIMKVHINSIKEQIISIGENKEIRIHDLNTQTCVQTFYKRSLLAFGQRAVSASFFNPSRQALLLATTVTGVLENREEDIKSLALTSHIKQVNVALYNPLFKQVVSAATDSKVCVWNIYSGEKVMQFTAHTSRVNGRLVKVEVTFMTFDPTFRRLITAGRDGSVKVWNFNNGAMLRELPTTDSHDITSIVCPEQRILTGGWNKKITVYIDDVDDDSFRDLRPHCTDDIHSLALFPPNLVAAGTNAGDIMIWSLDTKRPVMWLDTTSRKTVGALELKKYILNDKKEQKKCGEANLQKSQLNVKDWDAQPKLFKTQGVCKLAYLTTRTPDSRTAILVAACDSGFIQCWSSGQNAKMLGEFLAVHRQNQSLTSMVVSHDDHFIVNSDSQGYVKVWDISHYCLATATCCQEVHEERENVWKKFPFTKFPSPSLETNRGNPNTPHLINSFHAHLHSITSVDLADVKGRQFIITASADCSVRLFTIEGQYMGIFGQRAHWGNVKSLIEDGRRVSYHESMIPPDIRRVASATTLRVLRGGTNPMWRSAKAALSWVTRHNAMHRAPWTAPVAIQKLPAEPKPSEEELEESEREADETVEVGIREEKLRESEVLGQSYKPSTKHRPLPRLQNPVKQYGCLAFSSLPYVELDNSVNTEIIQNDATLRDIQKKYRLPPLLKRPDRKLHRKVNKFILARRLGNIAKK